MSLIIKMSKKRFDIVDHIAIQVSDVGTSLKWYKRKYKCAVIYADSTWGLIQFNNIKLALVSNNEHPPHIAFLDNQIHLSKGTTKHRDGSISKYYKDLNNNYIEHVSYDSQDDDKDNNNKI